MVWRIIQGKNRRGGLHKFLGLVPRRTQIGNCIWMHAVSVGEVNLLQPIVEANRSWQVPFWHSS